MTSTATKTRALNRLIVACRDDIRALDAASRAAADSGQKERLRSMATARRRFIGDLATAVRTAGGVAAAHGSLGAAADTWVGRARTFVGGAHEGDAYARCARVEARTEARYADALAIELGDDVHFGVIQQRAQIARDRADLESMRDRS